MAIESTYPVAEVATSGVLNILYNVLPMLFLVTFLLPIPGKTLGGGGGVGGKIFSQSIKYSVQGHKFVCNDIMIQTHNY